MIWGDNFVWIHIGRTGGYSVDRMCRILGAEDIHFDPLGGEWSRWKRHQTIEQREAESGLDLSTGRAKVTNFRRLPHWILSFAEYKRKHEGLELSDEEMARGFLKAEYRELDTGVLDTARTRRLHPDEVLTYYGVPQMDSWLRTEHLADDFLCLMERWYSIRDSEREQIHAVHENANSYERDLSSRFSKDRIQQMYDCCPVWTDLELKLYGDLLL